MLGNLYLMDYFRLLRALGTERLDLKTGITSGFILRVALTLMQHPRFSGKTSLKNSFWKNEEDFSLGNLGKS